MTIKKTDPRVHLAVPRAGRDHPSGDVVTITKPTNSAKGTVRGAKLVPDGGHHEPRHRKEDRAEGRTVGMIRRRIAEEIGDVVALEVRKQSARAYLARKDQK